MKPFSLPPWGANPPDTTVDELTRAIQAAVADAGGRSTEIKVADWNIGCDGFPIVSVGDGTVCHDDAKPGEPGAKKFLVSTLAASSMSGGGSSLAGGGGGLGGGRGSTGIGGSGLTVQVVPLVGRAFSGNEGYGFGTQQGSALSSNESLSGGGGGSYSPPPAPTGASGGYVESGRRFAVCVNDDRFSQDGDRKILMWTDPWDNGETPVEVAITTLPRPCYVSLLNSDTYIAADLDNAAYVTFDSTGELDDASMDYPAMQSPVTSPSADYAFATQYNGVNYSVLQVIQGPGDPSTAVMSTVDMGDYGPQVYGQRPLAVNPSGDLLYSVGTAGGPGRIYIIRSPYTEVYASYVETGYDGTGDWSAPPWIAVSPDGKWLAFPTQTAYLAGFQSDLRLIYAPDGRSYWSGASYTRTFSGKHVSDSYGDVAFGADGRLFFMTHDDASNAMYLTVLKPDDDYTAAEYIDLGFTDATGGEIYWMSVSADCMLVAIGSCAREIKTGADVILVLAPFTSAGATLKSRDYPSGINGPWFNEYQFEFDRALGLTPISVDPTTVTISDPISSLVSGELRLTRTIDCYNPSATETVYAVVIDVDLLDAEVFVSANAEGTYHSDTHSCRWVAAEILPENDVTLTLVTRLA